MQHFVYSIRCFVVPVNSLLLAMILYSSVITTLVYNDFCLFHDVISEFDRNLHFLSVVLEIWDIEGLSAPPPTSQNDISFIKLVERVYVEHFKLFESLVPSKVHSALAGRT